MSFLVVGSVAFDGIETPSGKLRSHAGRRRQLFCAGREPLRAGATGRHRRRRLYDEGRGGLSSGQHIDLAGLERAAGKTFFWAGRYSQNMNERTTLATELNVFANFNPTLPDRITDSSLYFSRKY